MQINTNYDNLEQSYLFSTIARKVREYSASHPEADIIRLGIGDVTRPLVPAVIDALHAAVEDQAKQETFHGYGDEQGYDFLHEALVGYYKTHGVELATNEILHLRRREERPRQHPRHLRQGQCCPGSRPGLPGLRRHQRHGRPQDHLRGRERGKRLPAPAGRIRKVRHHLYLLPNNPTGAAYDRAGLKAWVDYANAQNAVILYDAAYECFIEDENLPRSIYEIEGAKTCAIEFCSFSKMAGFTGTRCGWTVVPTALADGRLNKMWLRRQTTKFNGVPYIVQKGAAACFTEEGMKQIKDTLGYYKQNAKVLSETLDELGIWYTGGKSSPYLWLKCPNGMDSWTFFDYLLENANVVGTPGAGFGRNGDGFFRLTAFGDQKRTLEAAERLKKLLAK